MSDDAKVQITIGANLDGSLPAATGEAKEKIEELGQSATKTADQFGELDTGLESLAKSTLETVVSIEALDKAFELTAKAAEEFGLSTSKFAAMLGMSEQQAAGLEAALKGVGSSTEEYETMALRLEMRLKTQEDAWNAYGMATRDANGGLLSGQQLMQSAISTMEQYKTGTDQNEFALSVFGRSAKDVYDILRVTKVAQDEFIQDMRDLGVQTDGAGEKAAQFEDALAREEAQWRALGVVVGQSVEPAITNFLEWAATDGKADLQVLEGALKLIATAGIVVGTVFDEDGRIISGVLVPAIEYLGGVAKVSGDILHRDFVAAWADTKATMSQIGATFHDVAADMEKDAKAAADSIAGLWGNMPKGGANPFESGGTKNFTAVDPKKEADAADKAAEIARRLSDEIAQSDEQLSLKKIAAAESANSFELSMGQESLDQWKAIAVDEANAKYAAELTYLQKKAAADKGKVVEEQRDLDQIKALHQEQANALAAIDQQYAEKKRAQDQAALADKVQADNAEYADTVSKLNAEVTDHQISASQRAASEIALATKVEAEELAMFDATHQGLTKGTLAWDQAMKQRQAIIDAFTKRVDTANNQLATEEQLRWKKLGTSIESSFNSALDGMIFEGKSFGQGMEMIAVGIAKAFLQMGEDLLENWIETQIAKLLITKATGTEGAADQITSAAAVAGAQGTASFAGAPWPVDMGAPAFGASMSAAALAYSGMLGLETGTNYVLKTAPYLLHEGEAVTPKQFNPAAGARLGGGGGTHNWNFAPNIRGVPQIDIMKEMYAHETEFKAYINRLARNGSIRF